MLVPDDLDTPAVVVSAERVERNLTRMAAAAGAAGVALRPHAKTHKCLPIARRQLSLGAAGLTVATLLEAELFASEGCPSVFIAYPLWAGSGDSGARLAALRGLTSLRVGVDSEAAAAALAAAAPGLAALIEVDSGQHRSGVGVDRVASLGVSCAKLGLTVAGAFTHPGHAYSAPSAAGDAARDERAALAAAGEALTGAGVLESAPVLSGGSTPTASAGVAAPLTEVRPGTYVFGDRQQMHLSGLSVDDVALIVAARVVSVPRPGEAVLDAAARRCPATARPGWPATA